MPRPWSCVQRQTHGWSLGSVKCTTQNLTVVRVDAERHLLLIKGAVPGAVNSSVVVRPSVKAGA